ncbi:hypothetical protein CEUSTIGMA_g8605.t1 [Chlamydomonas eustigma]|uniref:Methyltransferase FkbM domain-containing protein n=1 Tax=Chlamydomonas eustigma TaxID=1157962 RepID=A0A250XE47_9CHLO|nr:hypothetical protein CEUSTIGMA_g8605.t1 [Chlamydomonas eustigma]|eukprot:GAX81172.1 hypothetical protein CEUSTIGMA_g8605.t1 [Chlamydomonas eustigma]
MMSKESKSSGTTIRYVLAAILGGLGFYFLFGFFSAGGSFHSAHTSTCKGISSSDLNLVEVYRGDGSLDLRMYVFSQDAISKEVMMHSEKKVHAASLLKCSVAANKNLKVQVVQEGVSSSMGQKCLLPAMSSNAHQAMLAPKNLSTLDCEPSLRIPVVTLDHYWKDVLGSKQVLFVKLDVEGHEYEVLKGASLMMAAAPPTYILMEYSTQLLKMNSVTSKDFLKLIFGYGYRIYDCKMNSEVRPGKDGENTMNVLYQDPMSMTDLLLVQKSKFPAGVSLPDFQCGA